MGEHAHTFHTGDQPRPRSNLGPWSCEAVMLLRRKLNDYSVLVELEMKFGSEQPTIAWGPRKLRMSDLI